MIPVTTIISQIESALDAEGFDQYKFDEDYKPAINYAQGWLTQLYSRVMGDKKFSEEMVRDLAYIRVWKTSVYGRIDFDIPDMGGDLWTVLGVYPEAQVTGSENPPLIPLDSLSYPTDYLYLKSYYSAKRATLENVNDNRSNPFAKGNEIILGDLKSYSYSMTLDFNAIVKELEVQPSTGARQTVAVAYLLQPTDITATTDSVKFPVSMTNLIVEKALAWISYKQGDRTNLDGVTEKDVQKLIQLTT
jgi:hypothetical protein